MLNKMQREIGLFIILAVGVGLPAGACTGITVTAKDGTIIRARTLEFGTSFHSNLIVVPRGYHFVGANGEAEGLSWAGKFAFVATNALDMVMAADGVNEMGLSGGIFYFPGYASFTKLGPNQKARAPWDVISYALSTAATVDEAVKVVVAAGVGSIELKQWGFVPPVHYVFTDATGKSLVLEFTAAGPKVYANPLGVITNSPAYDWQMTNLRNYVGLSELNPSAEKLGQVTVNTFGQGEGMRGLPGDFTPPSRFVRAVAFSYSALSPATSLDGVLTAFHLLNNFDIPKGSVRDEQDGNQVSEYTEWTSAADVTNRRYYVRTFQDSNIRMVDLMRCNLNAKDVAVIKLDQTENIADLTPAIQ